MPSRESLTNGACSRWSSDSDTRDYATAVIKRVVRRRGFVGRLAADLPEDVVALVDAHLLDLAGTYGHPEAGDPIQYDELRIEHDEGDVE